ncbi:MAG: glycosyltransferase [Planctomycetota bacterium]|nr:glycosyltransferase [Planctomycetota bacterium]
MTTIDPAAEAPPARHDGSGAGERARRWTRAGWVVALAAAGGVLLLAGAIWIAQDVAGHAMGAGGWGRAMTILGWSLAGVNLAATLWWIVLVTTYRPVPAVPDDELPTCTVIVPAYNEGAQVLKTLRSIAASDYPPGKLQVVAVDDGSKDDTWEWICRGAREFPHLVQVRRMEVNRGKRLALCEGFALAHGEILVTVDSDSEVEPATLRQLVSPFVRDARVGGVAGNVRILNRRAGIIPRMLDVSFAYSFDFIRAAQSRLDTVLCTPGALSAYRRNLVMKVLPEWLAQTFCGRPADIGEDRAITNLVLREGHLVRYQQTATVYTEVPTRYVGLCRMFLRWARSNIRETIVLTRFAFGPFRAGPATGARINLLLQWVGLTLGQVAKLAVLAALAWMPGHVAAQLLAGAAVCGTLPAAVYALRYRSLQALWAFPYNLLWTLGLSWIALYAWLTPHKTSWLTRGLLAPRQAHAPAPADVEVAAPLVVPEPAESAAA